MKKLILLFFILGFSNVLIAQNVYEFITDAAGNRIQRTTTPMSVAITVAPSNVVCSGTTVTFTATAINPGTSPSYQWLLNGESVGSNSSTYSCDTLSMGDTVKCKLTSNLSCTLNNPAYSNEIVMVVNEYPVADAGTDTTFTGTPISIGSSLNGPGTISWLPDTGLNNTAIAEPLASPSDTTTYTLTVEDNGCISTDTVTISFGGIHITGRTMYAGKANAGTAPNAPTYDSRIYDINKEIVILKNQSGKEIARDTTDIDGAFSFANVFNGTYTLSYDKYTADTMQWCNDVNAIDLSMILYLVGHDTTTDPSRNFSRIYKKAANVDNNSTINAVDKARIQAKIAAPNDPTKNFPKGNWVNLDTTITVNGSNLNFTIPVISYGDYNASSSKYRDSTNTWSQVKPAPDENIISIAEESMIISSSGLLEIPLRISSSVNDFSAMGLELYYPKEKFRLESASMPNTSDSNGVFKINPSLQEIIDHNDDLLVTDDSGIIRVVFATINFYNVQNNDIMIYLGFRPLYELEPGELNFKLFGTGIIANQYGEEAKDEDYLLMPKIFVQGNHSEAVFDFTGYPNPFKGSTTLTYNLPENGKVKLSVYNTLGVCVAELVNESQMSGKHTVVFSTDNQQTAIYTVRLDFLGEQNSNCSILKMTHFK